jgi:hypothetical protein
MQENFYFDISDFKTMTQASLAEVIQQYALDGIIVIASFDVTYAPMALNLYMTSFKRFNITNHVFLASDVHGCGKLEPHGAHCVQYSNISIAKGPSIFDKGDYNIKANVKPSLVLDCLKTGVSVLLVDLDIVFLKNPLPILKKYNKSDIIIQEDICSEVPEANSGFFLVMPTRAGIDLFDKVMQMIPHRNPTGDQVYINKVLDKMKLKNQIEEHRLDAELYSVGEVFFTRGHRMFIGDNPCPECVIVHNNYIVSLEAKRYRFMEYGLWAVDEDGYYSNQDRKYIMFDNPIDFSRHSMDTRAMELKSLKFALTLGHILNRTVILPRFHCAGALRYSPLAGQKCHFSAFFCIRRFESQLPLLSTYRENVFLMHPAVPQNIKSSKTRKFVIDSEIRRNIIKEPSGKADSDVTVMKPRSGSGVSPTEVKQWFANESHRVLVFHSLYNDITEQDQGVKAFVAKLGKALRKSDFMQILQ